MRYLGGKFRIRNYIAKVIGNGEHLIEPFMGGGSMTAIFAKQFKLVEAYDIHEDLILMWQELQKGWSPPLVVSEQQYYQLKYAKPSALRGFVGYGCSWGGKWFAGYARANHPHTKLKRDFIDGAITSFKRDMPWINKVKINCQDYRLLKPTRGAVIYADPPYKHSTGAENFNHDEFWQVANEWVSSGCKVYVSEFYAPKDWQLVWEKHRTMFLRDKDNDTTIMIERLFTK